MADIDITVYIMKIIKYEYDFIEIPIAKWKFKAIKFFVEFIDTFFIFSFFFSN